MSSGAGVGIQGAGTKENTTRGGFQKSASSYTYMWRDLSSSLLGPILRRCGANGFPLSPPSLEATYIHLVALKYAVNLAEFPPATPLTTPSSLTTVLALQQRRSSFWEGGGSDGRGIGGKKMLLTRGVEVSSYPPPLNQDPIMRGTRLLASLGAR